MFQSHKFAPIVKMQDPGKLSGTILIDHGWVYIQIRDWKRSFPVVTEQWENEMKTAHNLLVKWNDQLGCRVNGYSYIASTEACAVDLPVSENVVCMKAGEAWDPQTPFFFFDRELILDVVQHSWTVHLMPQVPIALNVRVDANGVHGTTPSAQQQRPMKQVIGTYIQGCFMPLVEYMGKLACRKHKLDERFHRSWYHIDHDESDFRLLNLTCKNFSQPARNEFSANGHSFETPPNPRLSARVTFRQEDEPVAPDTPNTTPSK